MDITCDLCGKDLLSQGALVFSPPSKRVTVKYHVCKACWALEIESMFHD